MENREDLNVSFGLFKEVCEKLNSIPFDEDEDEFDAYKVRNIMFRKLKEMSQKEFSSEDRYIDCCNAMDNIAITLLSNDGNEE
jgi:hypothetical protein